MRIERVLVELDDDHVVRRQLRVLGQQRRVREDERPDARRAPTSAHRRSNERQCGHMGRGGKRRRPQCAHVWTRSSPRGLPSQNGAPSVSVIGEQHSRVHSSGAPS